MKFLIGIFKSNLDKDVSEYEPGSYPRQEKKDYLPTTIPKAIASKISNQVQLIFFSMNTLAYSNTKPESDYR